MILPYIYNRGVGNDFACSFFFCNNCSVFDFFELFSSDIAKKMKIFLFLRFNHYFSQPIRVLRLLNFLKNESSAKQAEFSNL